MSCWSEWRGWRCCAGLYDGGDEAADRRLAEVRRLLDEPAFLDGELVREASPRSGYRLWSDSYDEPGNPIIALEQPTVWSILEGVPPGRALDAACGTGRHARRLVALGHDVLGVDLTPEMLARAALNVPQARFAPADLRALPVADEQFELVVCGLALAHLAELGEGVAELTRVLAPGGRMVLSVLHPFQAHLGWQAPFADADGQRAFVREHAHGHADYLAAFRAVGLQVRDCLEPVLTAHHLRAKRRAFGHIPEATIQAYAGIPGVLIWDVARS